MYRDTSLFYDALVTKLNGSENFKDLAMVWEDVITASELNSVPSAPNYSTVQESQKVWNYFFKDWDNVAAIPIETKIKNYIKYTPVSYSGPDKEARRLANQIGHLDLLMTLFVLSTGTQQDYYRTEIDRYINGTDVADRPPLVAIDTVVRVSAPAYTSSKIYVSSVDYMMYSAGITPAYAFNSATAPVYPNNDTATTWDYKNIMSTLTDLSIAQKPGATRITNYTGDAYRNNAFSWGMGGVIGDGYLTTRNGLAEWRSSSVTNGIMETLIFKDNLRGFMIITTDNVLIPDPTPEGGFELLTDKPEENVIERLQATTIGEMVTVTLKGSLDRTEEDAWAQTMLANTPDAGYPQIKIDLDVTTPIGIQADNGGSYPINTGHNYKGNAVWLSTTEEDIMNFLKGGSIDWTHSLSSYPIGEDEKITFTYKASIEIKLNSTSERFLSTKIVTLSDRSKPMQNNVQ